MNGKILFLPLLLCCFAINAQQPVIKNSKANNRSKPNVVIIMADDLLSSELSCYGGQNIKTYHIDALAAQGLKFNQMYASEAMCVPTRASLFTGLYPARHGSYQNHKKVYPQLKSIAHYLSDLGYRVALTGKDHSTKPATVFPFQIIKGFEPNCVAPTADYFLDSLRQFISREEEPYCLFVMSTNPHVPWTVGDLTEFNADKLKLPPTWVDTKETREAFRKYLAEVRKLDNEVGDIMQLLKETGQEEETMVIFLGEQGPQFPGGKWTLWNAGQKSSMIVRLPGKIKGGKETNAIVQYEDITPTLIDIAGGAPVNGLDGKSFLKVLQGKTNKHRDVAYGIHNNIPEGSAYPMRSIVDTKYKLIWNLTPDSAYYIKYSMNLQDKGSVWSSWMAVDKNNAKQLTQRVAKRPAIEFYDLEKDPWEQNNLAGKPAYTQLIQQYRSKLEQWMQQQGDKGTLFDVPIKQQN